MVLALLLLTTAGAGAAQQSSSRKATTRKAGTIAGMRWHHVEARGSGRVGIVLAWPVGGVHDPTGKTGLAQVMQALLHYCQDPLPDRQRFVPEAHDRFSLLWATVRTAELPQRLRLLGRVLSGRVAVSEDLHALALARARLLADDMTRLYPGSVLLDKARRSLWAGAARGRTLAGVPAEIATITREALTAHYRDHYGSRGAILVTVGDAARSDIEKSLGSLLRRPTGSGRALAPVPPPDRTAARTEVTKEEIHPRVLGPYVTVALRALPADDPDYPAFLVAMAALRYQAAQRFGSHRGTEWRARFPFVRYQYLHGDPLIMVNRRGRNGASPAAARAEISDLLARVRKRGINRRWLEMARRELSSTLDGTSAPGRGQLVTTARVLAVRELLGFPADLAARVQAVTHEVVQAVCRRCLAEDQLCWLALLARPMAAPKGFRRRD